MAYIGLGLPISAQAQVIWDKPASMHGDGAKNSWGGHCVIVVGYDAKYVYAVTWGEIKKMTWAFWLAYCDESYAVISPDFFIGEKTPAGFDLATLRQDLAAIKH
jgi:hypothetical protein